MNDNSRWQLWIDTGGTFTDCFACDPRGALHRAKVLSSSCLRGRLGTPAGPNRWNIDAPWNLPANFCTGAHLASLDTTTAHPPVPIVAHPHPRTI
ncbi:MAG: hydantoinase/oxoprolinase N-terminal domain-containing protein, partial [Myxococcota bacterium]